MAKGGFFDYDKFGPGVKKDGPQKKTIFVILEIWLRNFWKLITVNFIYCFLKLLIIPSGLADAGMTNVARNLARDKHSFGISDFYDTIKKNWKQALPAGIINIFITALLGFAIYFYCYGKDVWSIIGFGFSTALFVVFTFMKYHVWLIVITFKLKLSQIYKNSFLFVFVNLKSNFIISIVTILLYGAVATLLLIPYYIAWIFAFLIAVLVLPGLVNIIKQYLIFPKVKKMMIDPYYEEHPGEDLEARRGLGLEVEEENSALFDDEAANKKPE